MIKYKAVILKYGKNGDKTGWSYVVIPADFASKLKPENKKSFRVKGKLDNFLITKTALLPIGNGEFMLPINAAMRKGVGKSHGDVLYVQVEEDKSEIILNTDLITCLEDEPAAFMFFKTLTASHQRYFSKWIESAKTDKTKSKRIAMAVNALARGYGYPEMLREAAGKSLS